MWSNLMYFLPIATILASYSVDEDTHLEGKLETDFPRFVQKHVHVDQLRIVMDSKISAEMNLDFPARTSIWTIFDSVMHRYHLMPEIKADPDGAVVVTLRKGSAWSKEEN